jgi:hypothetical protein
MFDLSVGSAAFAGLRPGLIPVWNAGRDLAGLAQDNRRLFNG